MSSARRRRRWLLFGAACAAALAAAFVVVRRGAHPAPGETHAALRSAAARLAAGDRGAARRIAEAVLGADPRSADARFLRACARAGSGDRTGAFADLEACAHADPADAAICLDAALVARALARDDVAWRDRAHAWFEETSRRTRGRDDVRSALVDAAACVALGRLDDAERRLSSAGEPPGPFADDADALRAAVLVARGDAGAAIALLRRATSQRRSPALAAMLDRLETAVRDPLLRGMEAARGGDVARARALLREAATASAGDLTPVALLAATFGGPGVASAAHDEVRRLADAGLPAAAGPLLVGTVLSLHGDAEGARAPLRRALERAPDDPAVLRAAVLASLACGDAAGAAEQCWRRLARGDGTGLADFLLGVALEQAGDDSAAEASYRGALVKDAAGWLASDRLAELLLRRGDVPGAALVCDAGLAADPECLPLRLRRADVWVAAGDASRAADLLARDAAAHPGCAAIELHRARALLAAGDGSGAAARFGACLAADPDCVEAHVGAIALAAASGRLAEVVAALRVRADSNSRDAVARFALGVAAERSGDAIAAEREYRAALALAPRLAVAANNLAWLLAGLPGRAAEARPFAETAGRLLPRNPHVLDTRGWVRLLNGDAAGAEDDLARAARMLPDRADVAARHARALASLVPEASVSEPPKEVPR
jgi:tetratricopeptide (TPR) repeat protein